MILDEYYLKASLSRYTLAAPGPSPTFSMVPPFDVNLCRRSRKSMKMAVKSWDLVSVAAVVSIKRRVLLSSPGFPRSL